MASWNSIPLQVLYQVLGWLAFFCWSISCYPQIILNFRRKRCLIFSGTFLPLILFFSRSLLKSVYRLEHSVVGLNLDFQILNLTKHTSYLIYNASLYFSSVIQKQYFDKYGSGQMIPVAANDVAFSTHAVIMTLIVLFQVAIYERGGQKFSKSAIATVSLIWLIAAVSFFVALSNHSWLWLISIFNSIQVCMTLIKYMPQAIMNFLRKSTDGFSIGGVLLDFSGGVFNYSQMAVQSIDQGSWVNFFGNVGKVLISLVTIFYDSVFMFQHYVLYLGKKAGVRAEANGKMREPLICPNSIDVTDQQIKDLQKSCDRPLPQEEA